MMYPTSVISPRFDITHPILVAIQLGRFYTPVHKFRLYSISDGAILLVPYIQEELSLILHYLIATFLPVGFDSNFVTVMSNTPLVKVALAVSGSTAGLNLRL